MPIYVTSTDISNRALQLLGANTIASLTENSKNAAHCLFLYDKMRRAELRANPWNFSARRCVLRPFVQGVDLHLTNVIAWNPASVYPPAAVVSYNGMNWVNLYNPNINNIPGQTAFFPYTNWMEFYQPTAIKVLGAPGTTTYYTGEVVAETSTVGAALYMHTGPNPATTTPPDPPWVHITISEFDFTPATFIPYPLGRTTTTINTAKNLFPMPTGFMRVMSQDPKSVAAPNDLTTAGMVNTDFEFEAGFLLSSQSGPIVFRFAGDIQSVFFFEDLFIEAVACRMALGMCETLTQSQGKAQMIQAMYNQAIQRGISVNAIEAGSTEPATEDAELNQGPTREKIRPQQQQAPQR